jgi:hypothetical protein
MTCGKFPQNRSIPRYQRAVINEVIQNRTRFGGEAQCQGRGEWNFFPTGKIFMPAPDTTKSSEAGFGSSGYTELSSGWIYTPRL